MKFEGYLECIQNDSEMKGAVQILEMLGITTGEISQNQAFKTYGRSYITELVNTGRLKPCSVGHGKNGTIKFYIPDILEIRRADRIQALITI